MAVLFPHFTPLPIKGRGVKFALPARFLNSRNQATTGHVAEANTANAKLPIDGAGPAAQPAPHPNPDPIARPQLFLVQRQLLVFVEGFQVPQKLGSFGSCGHQFLEKTVNAKP
jgi:hypothetical protein